MRFLYLPAILFLLSVGIFAQQPLNSSDDSNLKIIKNKWSIITQHYKRILPTYPVSGESEPERWKSQIAENRSYPEFDTDPKVGKTQITPISVYEIKVKNQSQKTIQEIVWKYQFIETGQTQAIIERTLYSFEKIKPNSSKNLILQTRQLPFGTYESSWAAKKSKRYLQKAVIERIKYTDGSVWTNNN